MKAYYIAITFLSNTDYEKGERLSPGHPTEKECLDYMIENFEGHLMFEVKRVYIIEEDNFVDSE